MKLRCYANHGDVNSLSMKTISLRNIFLRNSIVLLLSLTPFIQTPALSQEASCLRRTLALTLADSQGTPVSGLSATDLKPKFHVSPIRVLSLVPDDRPHRIVILIDASGSMTTRWREALAIASALAETALPTSKMALLVFKDKIEEQVGFSEGQKAIAEKLRLMRSTAKVPGEMTGGRTAIFDSLLAGLQLLGTPTSADSLYLISDGADNASHVHLEDVEQRLCSNGVRVFVSLTLGHFGERLPTEEERNGPSDMNELAKRTGGQVNVPYGEGVRKREQAERLAQTMDRFFKAMVENYRLELELPAPLKKAATWELLLSDQAAVRWRKATLAYPTQLAPCKR